MNKKNIIQERELMISQIKKYSSLFKPFFELDITLEEYSKGIYQFNHNSIYIKRQELVKTEIINKFKKLFGPDCKQKLEINFDPQLAMNIVDHHQILNHPLLISDNVIANFDRFFRKEKQNAIIVISSGDVPPNNYFSKNGFQLHNKKVPIFSSSERELCSFYIPKRDFNFVDKLKQSKRWKEFNEKEQKFLIQEFEKISSLDFSGCQDYKDQITVIVKSYWPYLFEEKIRKNLPELLYITQEELTTNCLLKLLDQDNFITHTLFDKDFRDRVIETFRGIVVTWDEKENKGTHFFWRKHPSQNKAIRMYLKDGYLIPADERFKDLAVKLEKREITDLLKKKEIYPSLFIIFAVLNFYFGIKPLVGHGSIVYLNFIRDNWLKILEQSKFKEEMANIKSFEIDKMISGIGLFFDLSENKAKTLYAYDIFYQGGISEEYLKKIFTMKFQDLLAVSVSGIYDYISQKYIPEKEKIEPKASPSDLAEILFTS